MSPLTRRRGVQPNHAARRYLGMLVMVSTLSAALGLYATLALAIYPDRNTPYHRAVERLPFENVHAPSYLVEHGFPPNTPLSDPPQASEEIRSITVHENGVQLRIGGELIRDSQGADVSSLQQLHRLLDDPSWLEEVAPGEYLLKAALVVREGAHLTIGGPDTVRVSMLDRLGVFIGASGGTLDFVDVTIDTHVSDEPGDEPYNPFVVADSGATMNAFDSRFTRLGWDWNGSYGVSWVVGATGEVVGSTFDHNFIGVYTSAVEGMLFKDSEFNDNILYGLDPHTNSRNLVVDGVLAQGNQAHGIIFSYNVTDSIVRNSTSRNNGENGIMMDEMSTNNLITGNVVADNSGDGLVTADSPGNTFADNHVQGNRVGVRVDPDDTGATTLDDNTLVANDRVAENIALNESNVSMENGGEINWGMVRYIWTAVLVFVVLFSFAFAVASREGPLRRFV